MEPVTEVNFASSSHRPVGWQAQMRVDYVVHKIMQTHRGQAEEVVAQAIQELLRSIGVVPNGRQVQQYAAAIAQLPALPPRND